MRIKTIVMEGEGIQRSLKRISHEIVERNKGVQDLVLLGILTHGVQIASILKDSLEELEGKEIPLGVIDISNYRDDRLCEPSEDKTDIPFSIEKKKIILVDDVLFTGRTIRAAIELIFDLGRAASIQVAVLVDRGHRELPIRPDFVGKNIPTSQKEKVVVNLQGDPRTYQVTIVE